MDVSRRRGLLALAAAAGALLLKAPPLKPLARVRSLMLRGTGLPPELSGGKTVTRRRPSRSVQPDPHSVKRHG